MKEVMKVRFGRNDRGGFRGGGGFDRERYDEPKPVKEGEEYDVEISEVGAKGDGIARIKNFVVFVTDVKKGDKVRIKITEVRERFATGSKVGAAAAAVPAEATEVKADSESKESEKSEEAEESKDSEESEDATDASEGSEEADASSDEAE